MPPSAPDTSELRRFGLLIGTLLALFFGLLLPWLWGARLPLWPWLAAAPLWALGLAYPPALAPIYRLWMGLAHVLGWVNTRIILGLVFFVVILPAGLLLRLLGKDPLARRLDPAAASYRVPSTARPRDNLERPF